MDESVQMFVGRGPGFFRQELANRPRPEFTADDRGPLDEGTLTWA
jgi:hypothetical protein